MAAMVAPTLPAAGMRIPGAMIYLGGFLACAILRGLIVHEQYSWGQVEPRRPDSPRLGDSSARTHQIFSRPTIAGRRSSA